MVTEVLGSNEEIVGPDLTDGARGSIIGEPGACTQVVALMYNPATGDVRRATDGCQIEDLQKAGYTKDVPPDVAEDYYGLGPGGGSGGNGGGNGGGSDTDQDGSADAQSAGVGIGLIAAIGAGALYLSQ